MAKSYEMKKSNPTAELQASSSKAGGLDENALLKLLLEGKKLRQRMEQETAAMGIMAEGTVRLRFR